MLAFALLYQNKSSGEYIPAWKFVGEIEVQKIGTYGFMSYKCPARLSDLYNENPGLLERTMLEGKSGAKYYGYRFGASARRENIADKKMLAFYERIRN
jgi:hypothetical protein